MGAQAAVSAMSAAAHNLTERDMIGVSGVDVSIQ
jgi:hypothetical protein